MARDELLDRSLGFSEGCEEFIVAWRHGRRQRHESKEPWAVLQELWDRASVRVCETLCGRSTLRTEHPPIDVQKSLIEAFGLCAFRAPALNLPLN